MSSASDVAAKMTPNINDEAWMLVNKLLLDKVVIGEIGYVGKHGDQQIIKISRQYVHSLEDAAVHNNPLLLFMFDEGKGMITGGGHANVLVIKKEPAAAAAGGAAEGAAEGTAEQYIATLYDNHTQDNHTYNIRDIRIMVEDKKKIPMVKTIQAKVTAWFNNLTDLATNIFKMDTEMFTYWYSTTGQSADDIPEILTKAKAAPEKVMAFCFDVDRTVYTGFQERYPNEGICLWSALIIYLELLEKKKKGEMNLTSEELAVIFKQNPALKLRSNPLGPHAYFQKLYDLVLKPQIADIYEDFIGQQSVNVAAVAGAAGGGAAARTPGEAHRSAPIPGKSRGGLTRRRLERSNSAPPSLGGKRKTRRRRKKGRVRKTKRKRKTRRRTKRRKRNYSRKT
jgi:hypothetical protein